MNDPERILTILYYLSRGKSLAASHRLRRQPQHQHEENSASSASSPASSDNHSVADRERETLENSVKKLALLDVEEYKLKMAPVISFFLTQLVRRNDKLPAPHKSSNVCRSFNAQTAPEITIEGYLQRITKYTPCSPECFLIAVIFIDRIILNHNLLLTSFNVHRFIITAIVIAAKIYDESTYNNKYYSHVGGVALKELNHLEHKFLSLLDF